MLLEQIYQDLQKQLDEDNAKDHEVQIHSSKKFNVTEKVLEKKTISLTKTCVSRQAQCGLWMKEIGLPMRWSTQIAWVVDCFCPIEVPYFTSGTSIQRCRKMNA